MGIHELDGFGFGFAPSTQAVAVVAPFFGAESLDDIQAAMYYFTTPPNGTVPADAGFATVTSEQWRIDEAVTRWSDASGSWLALSANGIGLGNEVLVIPDPPPAGTSLAEAGLRYRMTFDYINSGGGAQSLATGDVNGDGMLDLAVGVAATTAVDPSVVAIHAGPLPSGQGVIVGGASHIFDASGWEVEIHQSTTDYSRPFIHDVDGDGVSDVLLASGGYGPDDELPEFVPEYAESGALFLWTGATAPGIYGRGTETAVIRGTCGGYIAGLHGTVGAVGPDPTRPLVAVVSEILTTEGMRERGGIFLIDLEGVSGQVEIADISTAVILGEAAFQVMTDYLPVGDLNGDGHPDLIVSSRFGGLEGRGAVYVFLGPLSGVRTTATADLTLYGSDQDGVFGSTLATWEGDGDGVPDLLIGALTSSYNAPNAGAVYFASGAELRSLLPR
ncbi:MAG: integrin alpha [Myxococcota bacterium]